VVDQYAFVGGNLADTIPLKNMIYNFTTAAATAAVLILENGLRIVRFGKTRLSQAGLQPLK
jgi:hypothetical protein